MLVNTTKITDGPKGLQPIGTEIYGSDAWRLVVLGVAEPADQECRDKIAELEAAKESQSVRREFVSVQRAELTAAQQPEPVPAKAKPVEPIAESVADEDDTELAGGL